MEYEHACAPPEPPLALCRLIHCPQHSTGDILIFLTGREEIERCLEELTELIPTCVYFSLCLVSFLMHNPTLSRLPRGATQIIPLALHAGLSTEEQLRVFNVAERGTRKVIAATNIAEVSFTNPSILASPDGIRPASRLME